MGAYSTVTQHAEHTSLSAFGPVFFFILSICISERNLRPRSKGELDIWSIHEYETIKDIDLLVADYVFRCISSKFFF